ncbi:cell division protein FtsQ/DivIB [Clostridium sp.]|uniref:cell division protein FtsQ/DivIB n=1 Tax=Clostridium sp. TaxID=1506 RepID=UPI003D6D4B0E
MKIKNDSIDKGNYIIANSEKLLKKRKVKKQVRNLMLLVIIMLSTLVTLCLKLPYFNIENIKITGNVNASNAKINEQVSAQLNNNIFYANFVDSKKEIIKNPYILDVKIKKKLPNKISIEIVERVAVFYGKVKDTYYIIDNQGKLLEKKSNIKGMNLVNLVGLKLENCKVGDTILSENRKMDIANELANIINVYRKTKDNIIINSVDISNVLDVKVFSGKMCIKLGTTEDLENKFNRAINILAQPKYKTTAGYVDVSFKGNPVVHIQE